MIQIELKLPVAAGDHCRHAIEDKLATRPLDRELHRDWGQGTGGTKRSGKQWMRDYTRCTWKTYL